VRTDRDGSTVSFAEECKTAASAARLLVTPLVGKSAYARVSDSEPATRELLKVNLTNDFDIDETTIVFEDGQSSNADYNDAMYFSGSSVNLASLSANGKRLAINFMPDLADTNEVRLSVNAAGGGNYRLNFTETPSVAASVFLRDAYHQDHQTEIKKNSSYCFSIDRTDPNTFGEKRFTLIFKSNPDQQRTGKHDSPEIKVYPNPVVDRLYFNYATDFKGPLQIAVFDIKGEQMDFPEVLPANTASFDVSSLSPGIYILKLRSAIGKRRLGEIKFIKI
jgi:hypothetical protein